MIKIRYDVNCAICNQEPTWRGKPLQMRLDFVNGNNQDRQPDNIRYVCPHCQQQVQTQKRHAAIAKRKA